MTSGKISIDQFSVDFNAYMNDFYVNRKRAYADRIEKVEYLSHEEWIKKFVEFVEDN